MIGSLFNGLSGLDTMQKALTSQSNNISNVATVAYKSDRLSFADMLYQDGVGKGAAVASVYKDYKQGELKVTNDVYDVALQGDGFFVVDNSLDDKYRFTRAGNFRMGEDGTLQTVDLRHLKGEITSAASVVSSDPNITLFTKSYVKSGGSQVISNDQSTKTINAKITDYVATATADPITQSGTNYKSAGIKTADVERLSTAYREALKQYAIEQDQPSVPSTTAKGTITFDMASISKDTDILQVFLDDQYIKMQFDTDAETTIKKFADKISAVPGMSAVADTTTGKVTITALVPGEEHVINDARLNENDMPLETTAAIKGTGEGAYLSVRDALKSVVENAGASFLELTNTVGSLAEGGALPTGLGSIQLKLDSLGFSTNPFGTIEYDQDGTVFINQDGYKFAVGELSIVRFVDNLQLDPDGNNVLKATNLSGDPFVAYDTTTKVIGQTLELSNTDLAIGLTDLMIYQRAYEANAKTLTTSDEFLNIAIQLKR